MALTRKFLVAMGIEGEKIDEIINAHADTVEALKGERDEARKERDTFKADAEKLVEVQKELDERRAADNGVNPFESKYNDTKEALDKLQEEYDNYKKDVDLKAQAETKKQAYTALLEEAGISKRRINAVLKVTDLDNFKLDKDGSLQGKDKIVDNIKEEWSDFIVTETKLGADTPSPQANNATTKPSGESRAARIAAQYHNNLYGESKEA